jgi:hypothetical protein
MHVFCACNDSVEWLLRRDVSAKANDTGARTRWLESCSACAGNHALCRCAKMFGVGFCGLFRLPSLIDDQSELHIPLCERVAAQLTAIAIAKPRAHTRHHALSICRPTGRNDNRAQNHFLWCRITRFRRQVGVSHCARRWRTEGAHGGELYGSTCRPRDFHHDDSPTLLFTLVLSLAFRAAHRRTLVLDLPRQKGPAAVATGPLVFARAPL